jgi:glyoxylase-like metal-dependent hydrolase (beta-lactamase superfamily II)
MHPRHEHMTRAAADPERSLERRIEVAAQSGVPLAPLRRWAEERRGQTPGIAAVVMPDRDLVEGMEVETSLGSWSVHETPGHAPSHVVLFQPERRLLVSGDHLLGRVSLYFDYGWTPDPVAEFSSSLDVVERLGARLCLAGHGRPFADVQAHIDANREELRTRLEQTAAAIAQGETTAYDAVPAVFGDGLDPMMASWTLTMVLCYLSHLEREGKAQRISPQTPQQPELWTSAPTAVRP